MKWRIVFVMFIFVALYSALVFNVYDIQFEDGLIYLKRAESQKRASLTATRGKIYFSDKNGNFIPAALNKEFAAVYAVPDELQQAADKSGATISDYAEKLSAVTGVSAGELEKKFIKKNDLYELFVQKADGETVKKIKDLNIKGIYIENRVFRFYPFEKMASHILGFTAFADEDEGLKGRYGIELFFEDVLAGKSGTMDGNDIVKPIDGKNLVLTVDNSIQAETEKILSELVEKYGAKKGSILVQEPKSGKILAMANFPDFNPDNYSDYGVEAFLNPAVQAVYEPGSIFKVITMAAGIDSGKIFPDMTYFDAGSVTLNGKTIKNWDLKSHGSQTMTGVIEQSINTGAVFAQQKMGPDIFYNYLIKFGFNDLTGISLPGEVRGNIRNLKNGKEIDFATASFGQGVAVTPIELINAVSAIANGGALMTPMISTEESPREISRVISKDAAEAVTKMMISAVEKNVLAAIPNYSIAGKTGTAFIPDFKNGGYTDKVINSYAGFAPASDPKFVILIKLEEPKDSPLAGQTVVPVFRELTRFILNYYNIAPDKLANAESQT